MIGTHVSFEVKDHIGIIKINHPPVNSFVEDMRLDLAEIFESMEDRVDVYALILMAEGKGFSAGMDFNEMISTDQELRKRIGPTISRMTTALYNMRIPIIAAVHGYVIGLGFALATISDIIIASEDATFAFPEVTVGTVGGPFWFKRVIPDKIARYYFYTGKKMPVSELVKYGAVLRVVPKEQLLDEAMTVAKEIAANYPPSVWASKMVITEGEKEVQDVVDVSDRMRFRGNMEILGPDPNKKEMVRAKQERREPVYDLTFFLNRQKELKEKAAQEKKE